METFWIVVGAVVLFALVVAAMYDQVARRRGASIRPAGAIVSDTLQNHADFEAFNGVTSQGGVTARSSTLQTERDLAAAPEIAGH